MEYKMVLKLTRNHTYICMYVHT